MPIFIAVVSHGHGKLIQELGCLKNLAVNYKVVVKINKKEEQLIQYLELNNIDFIDEQYGLGFGSNNNVIYAFCKNKLGMKASDHFIVFNPDVIASVDSIDSLVSSMTEKDIQIAGVNLFKDVDCLIPDNSIRHFPGFFQFLSSFIGVGNSSIIDKAKITSPTKADWCAGSFIAFQCSHYCNLRGFDEKYFMYCEDIDICYRSKILGVPLVFYPEIKMVHLAEHANRKIFSKHFYWHISSIARFLLTKRGLTKTKSIITK